MAPQDGVIETIALEAIPGVYLLPVVHERLDLASVVGTVLDRLRPAAVAVELPTTLAEAVTQAVGRLPQISLVISEEPGEDALVWVVVGQQISLPIALALRRRLTELAGTRVNDRLFVPPTAESLARLEESHLRAIGFSRRKAEYLTGIARSVVAGSLDPEGLRERTATEIERTLLKVHGLGPWSVHYLMMRAFSLADCVPVGDVALAKSLMEFFDLPERPSGPQTLELMQPFAPYRSLATFHLWTRLGEVQ